MSDFERRYDILDGERAKLYLQYDTPEAEYQKYVECEIKSCNNNITKLFQEFDTRHDALDGLEHECSNTTKYTQIQLIYLIELNKYSESNNILEAFQKFKDEVKK